MKEQKNINMFLPLEYHENALTLLIQSPRVLYAYWELSPGLKNTLSENEKVQIRLNSDGSGVSHVYDIDLLENSCYFENVKPGLSYYCEIGKVNTDNIFLPLLRSNTVVTPHEKPSKNGVSTGEPEPTSSSNSSSKVFYRE
jgi:hypothetical protein